MGLARTSADAAVGLAQSLIGHSRKTPGCQWSKAPNVDDCAKFQSWLLWGDNAAGEGPIAWVDNFKTAPNGTYHPGKAGLRRGDVVLFDWAPQNGIGNHVEMATIAPNAVGGFQTIGANGSDTIDVGYRNRNAFVLGYFRPAYGIKTPTTSTASEGAATLAPKEPELMQSDIDTANAALYLGIFPEKAADFRKRITAVYKNRLGRTPDIGGLEGFVKAMALGKSITWVDAKVMASAEYKKRQAKLGAKAQKK